MSTSPGILRQTGGPPWLPDNSKRHPLPRSRMVRTSSGHVSTRKAGARANPAPASLRRPSKPGMIHHQGRDSTGLSTAMIGFSTWKTFSIFPSLSLEVAAQQIDRSLGRAVLGGVTVSVDVNLNGRVFPLFDR